MPTIPPLLIPWILLAYFPGFGLSAFVSLDSITIYSTHEWFKGKPTVYFDCKSDPIGRKELPDVKEVNVSYAYKGDESWQPLVEFKNKKCKRCGFYERDESNADDVFDEWEFCVSVFTSSDGKYRRVKKDEFDATFLCPDCVSLATDSFWVSHGGVNRVHVAMAIVISLLVLALLIAGVVAGYKYWQRRKRVQDQARFLKLFEDGDDIEDELELSNVPS